MPLVPTTRAAADEDVLYVCAMKQQKVWFLCVSSAPARSNRPQSFVCMSFTFHSIYCNSLSLGRLIGIALFGPFGAEIPFHNCFCSVRSSSSAEVS